MHPYIAVTSGATQRFGFVKMSVNRTHMTLDAVPVDWNYNTSEGGAVIKLKQWFGKERQWRSQAACVASLAFKRTDLLP